MTGMRDQYFPTEYAPKYQHSAPAFAGSTQRRVTFTEVVVDHWRAVELDLHTEFRVDVESGVLDDRTWRWFVMRIGDLIANPLTRVGRAVREVTTTPE